jgi:signal transduction histidine kinase
LRDEQDGQSKVRYYLERILQLPWILTQPSQAIKDEGTKRKARFLRTTLLTGVFAFPVLQIVSDPVPGFPIYGILALVMAGVYLHSGTEHVRFSSAVTIITAASLPFLILILAPSWTRTSLVFQILSWPVLAAVIGSQLVSTRMMAFLVVGMNLGLFMIILHHPGIDTADGAQSIAVALVICVLLLISSWTQQYYSKSLMESNRKLDAKRNELELYTRILRHDLGNDLQMVLGGIELSQISNGEYKQKAYLESTLAAAHRMNSLLQLFSLSDEELDTDILSVIEKISHRAEIAFKGMLVSIEATEEVEFHSLTYGRLLALAFENLLRNSAQHAGKIPSVEIKLSITGDKLELLFSDDGPGVDPDLVHNLFEKGTTTGEHSMGMGLYLAKTIIESENGSIELLNNAKPGCCFLIRLPLFNGQ